MIENDPLGPWAKEVLEKSQKGKSGLRPTCLSCSLPSGY